MDGKDGPDGDGGAPPANANTGTTGRGDAEAPSIEGDPGTRELQQQEGSSDAGSEQSVDALRIRMQRYLSFVNPSKVNKVPVDPVGNSHETIRSIRVGMLEAPGLYGGAISIPNDIGSFRPSGEAWGDLHYVKKIFNQKKVVGLSPLGGKQGVGELM
jgi:hypothetical protein